MDLGLIIGSSGLLGILILIFRMGKFNGIINSKFDAIDKRLDGIESEIKDLRSDVRSLDSRLVKLEVRLEERTLRVVHVQKSPKYVACDSDELSES